MTLQEYMAGATRESAQWLRYTIERMPADHIYWHPEETGRAVSEQIAECHSLNRSILNALRKRAAPEFLQEYDGSDDSGDFATALSKFLDESELLAREIELFPVDMLDDSVAMPWQGETERTFSWLIGLPYWNMTYHLGQLNYLQTAFGDLKKIEKPIHRPE